MEQQQEFDESAYQVYHKAETGSPCLSFSVIKDHLGDGRDDQFPMSLYLMAGTQAPKVHVNNILVIKMSGLKKLKQNEEKDEDEEESESEEEDEEDEPNLECAQVPHKGCVNRLRATQLGERLVAATWSELGLVSIWDMSEPLKALDDVETMTNFTRNKDSFAPIYVFRGHGIEGYAMDWSEVTSGLFASGDCNKNIHVWKPSEAFVWHVDQIPLVGHSDSVEDLQWSPNESNVLASCSVDKTIRIWDIRSRPTASCVITVNDAHDSDINVISWNKKDTMFLLSGGDDGVIKTWDLRQIAKSSNSIATFKYHSAPVTSIEWNPHDSTVFGASSEDNSVTLWDLALEKDEETEDMEQDEDVEDKEKDELENIPPQLLFVHEGQTEIKELHWHPQIPGIVISTALNGFDVFKTISV